MSTSDGSEEWWDTAPYPGWSLPDAHGPHDEEMSRQLARADRGRLWHKDFHYPRGLLPLSLALLDDLCVGAQRVARDLRLAQSGGLAARLVGPYVYLGVRPAWGWEDALSLEANRGAGQSPGAGEGWGSFRTEWATAASELVGSYERLGAVALEDLEPAQLRSHLLEARDVHAAAWRVHFAFMYRLLLGHRRFAAACAQLGIAEDLVAVLLQGEPTSVSRADSELWELACRARAGGLEDVFASLSGAELINELRSSAAGAEWLSRFELALVSFGQRSEVILDVGCASWAEEPALAMDVVAGQLAHGAPAPLDALARRDAAVSQVRERLRGAERVRFDQLLGEAREANFVWWNEEHNTVIDLRAHLPLRRAALEIGRRAGAPDPADALFLGFEELESVVLREGDLAAMSEVIAARRDYHRGWLERRDEMPSTLGSGQVAADPVLVEILGAGHKEHLQSAPAGPGGTLRGLGVAAGVARGPVRVARDPAWLPAVRSGEVLVCQATSPSWTTVFTRLAACVCEDGGMLTHAAIVSREYGLPCVCSVDDATRVLADGDLVEVDGTRGTVRVLRRASSG